jgi:hypothetical protein
MAQVDRMLMEGNQILELFAKRVLFGAFLFGFGQKY